MSEKKDIESAKSLHTPEVISVNVSDAHRSAPQRFFDSFKRMEFDDDIDPNLSEVEKAAIATARSPLNRSLKNRHLQMIAIGGAIGTGLFVGSGGALSSGGPAAVLIGWILVGIMMYSTVHALGELAVAFPVSGAFVTYNTRFIDASWGFTMAWNYAMQWLVILPLELVAASLTIQFWNSSINTVAWVAIFYVLIVSINFFGVRGYGEAEFVFSIIKVIAVIGFIILGVVLVCGGGPKGGYLGGTYWQNPGAFAAGFKGVCNVFVTAAFSFGGTELCGLAAAETANPKKSLPKATKQVFWRITLFYIVSLTLVGLLVPWDDPKLISKNSVDASASPFVIAITNAGIGGLPSVMNVVIMIAVLSVGNSSVFGCSRTLASLAIQGFAPKWVGYIDRQGRPLAGILISCIFGLLCFIAASPKEGTVFNWLLALSGLSSLFTWASICACHLRFRRALTVKGRGVDELAFTSQCGIIGSWFGIILNVLILIAQFWVALFPIGGSPNAADFFESYLTVPVLIAFYVFHKLWKRNWSWFIRAKDIDVDTGRREVDIELLKQEIAEEKAFIASKPFYYRLWHVWC
ncbi:unnamed protein product [Kuraishia capsulata CBS 1993]|uniref:Amino acid permease/ SLC12A domain-containing protein n=1 Tax=Kuraishia capsulata CBS 1993 TaxID=1382522 RepID=W6MFN3_9ASCO|nr:uncharacterized protein KUCA_T00000635001 [Kuraishia capsulata CBS 1993]CDK24669.1 unnamed protein product [Kuraishia capsulata CBS 1993]